MVNNAQKQKKMNADFVKLLIFFAPKTNDFQVLGHEATDASYMIVNVHIRKSWITNYLLLTTS